MFVTYLVFGVAVILAALYYLIKRKNDYWKNKNIPYLKPSLVLGNYGEYITMKTHVGDVVRRMYDKFSNEPYFGAYYGTEPVLVVRDPEIIKLVLAKDFYYFNGREASPYEDKELITTNIFFTSSDRWRVLRQTLTPLFSAAKLKNMFYLIENCNRKFDNMLKDEIAASNGTNILKVKPLMARYTMDCTCSCIFGVEANTMVKDEENNPFTVIGGLIFGPTTLRGYKNIVRAVWPRIFYGLGYKLFTQNVIDFFSNLLRTVFEDRKYQSTSRNDFIDLLLNVIQQNKTTLTGDSMNNIRTGVSEKVTLKADDGLYIANCVALFAAGFDTSAITLTFTLYELAKDKTAQEKVVQEVDAFLQKYDTLTYNCVNELPYLDACISEAMRLYPVLTNLTREVMEEYTFPSGLKVDKGVRVHIPIYALHYDPKFFPEPEKFQPERFLAAEKNNITPFSYMPFGGGHRLCIGMRLAKMEMLAGLVTIFSKYYARTAQTTPRSFEIDPRVFLVTHPKSDVPLQFVRRSPV